MPKSYKISHKVAKFCQIWSHCQGNPHDVQSQNFHHTRYLRKSCNFNFSVGLLSILRWLCEIEANFCHWYITVYIVSYFLLWCLSVRCFRVYIDTSLSPSTHHFPAIVINDCLHRHTLLFVFFQQYLHRYNTALVPTLIHQMLE